MFSNALENTIATQECWLNLGKLILVCAVFMKFFLNLGNKISYREAVASALITKSVQTVITVGYWL